MTDFLAAMCPALPFALFALFVCVRGRFLLLVADRSVEHMARERSAAEKRAVQLEGENLLLLREVRRLRRMIDPKAG